MVALASYVLSLLQVYHTYTDVDEIYLLALYNHSIIHIETRSDSKLKKRDTPSAKHRSHT